MWRNTLGRMAWQSCNQTISQSNPIISMQCSCIYHVRTVSYLWHTCEQRLSYCKSHTGRGHFSASWDTKPFTKTAQRQIQPFPQNSLLSVKGICLIPFALRTKPPFSHFMGCQPFIQSTVNLNKHFVESGTDWCAHRLS